MSQLKDEVFNVIDGLAMQIEDLIQEALKTNYNYLIVTVDITEPKEKVINVGMIKHELVDTREELIDIIADWGYDLMSDDFIPVNVYDLNEIRSDVK